ncbi:MAG TPA: L,D-transpeptidase, partial [Bradyrhizobium sp.]|nr:L,D-transpeptidase [Bradyrhizobium sp.]
MIYAEPRPLAPVRTAYAERSNLGGGFIEFLFGDGQNQGERYQQQPSYEPRRTLFPQLEPQHVLRQQEDDGEAGRPAFNPMFEKQLVDYHGKESAGTIIVDTPSKFLFLVQ